MELPMNIWRFSVRVPSSRFIESGFLQTVPQNQFNDGQTHTVNERA